MTSEKEEAGTNSTCTVEYLEEEKKYPPQKKIPDVNPKEA